VNAHALFSRVSDRHGFASTIGTKRFLKWADEFNPDMVWLHNIHGYYINIKLLFHWLKRRNQERPEMEIKWTLHDCWTMTGHCAYFTDVKCDKWKSEEGCNDCPQREQYPRSFIDNSRKNFRDKKELFTGLKNLTIITPSKWLAGIVKESFLQEYPVAVVYNTIDTKVFRKLDEEDGGLKALRYKYAGDDKKILLGISNVWDRRKGLEDLIKLSCLAGDGFRTIIIGLSNTQIAELPQEISKHCGEQAIEEEPITVRNEKGIATKPGAENLYRGLIEIIGGKGNQTATPEIIGISHTRDQEELVRFYNLADIFVNPTHEDNYPTVNLEAIACGTKVLTTDAGGSAETIE
jgi:glycosyltransferase involved in cell wall biosynthesis